MDDGASPWPWSGWAKSGLAPIFRRCWRAARIAHRARRRRRARRRSAAALAPGARATTAGRGGARRPGDRRRRDRDAALGHDQARRAGRSKPASTSSPRSRSAPSLAEAAELARAARGATSGSRSGSPTGITPSVDRLRELVRDGALGRPLLIQASVCDEVADPDGDPTRFARRLRSLEHYPPVISDGVHACDRLNYLLGEPPTDVQGWALRSDRALRDART